jgi:hypothetical protein
MEFCNWLFFSMFSASSYKKALFRLVVFKIFSASFFLSLWHLGRTECHQGIWGDLRREKQHAEYLFYSGQPARFCPSHGRGNRRQSSRFYSSLSLLLVKRELPEVPGIASPPAQKFEFW